MPAQARPPCLAPPTARAHSDISPTTGRPHRSGTTRPCTTQPARGPDQPRADHAGRATPTPTPRPWPTPTPPGPTPARPSAHRHRRGQTADGMAHADRRRARQPRRHHDRDRLTALRAWSNGHDHGRTPTEQQRAELAMGAGGDQCPESAVRPYRIACRLAGTTGLRWPLRGASGRIRGLPARPQTLTQLRQSVSGYRWPVSAIMRTPITDSRTSRTRARLPIRGRPAHRGRPRLPEPPGRC